MEYMAESIEHSPGHMFGLSMQALFGLSPIPRDLKLN
uniref:NMD3 ribosome export adaptor n=1 Tax=Mus musculus TaxID=10090 RepID=D6RHT4_MOUSE